MSWKQQALSRMRTGPGTDELRTQLQRMWGSVAGGWAEHAEFVDARGAQRDGDACSSWRGRGRASACSSWPAARAASGSRRPRSSAPGGEVVLSDVAPEMTAIAGARAEALGLANVQRPRARPRADRRAGRVLRRRALPRGAHARPRPGPRRARDRARAASGRPGRARGLGPAGAEPVARRRLRRGQRAARLAGAAARASRARSRSTTPTGSPALLADAGLADVERRRARRRRTARRRSRSGGRGRPRSRARSRQRLAALPEPARGALLARARAASASTRRRRARDPGRLADRRRHACLAHGRGLRRPDEQLRGSAAPGK